MKSAGKSLPKIVREKVYQKKRHKNTYFVIPLFAAT